MVLKADKVYFIQYVVAVLNYHISLFRKNRPCYFRNIITESWELNSDIFYVSYYLSLMTILISILFGSF
jgi:hypothetical protein